MKQGKQSNRIEKGWDKMEFLLDKELPIEKKKKRRFMWLFPLLGVSALFLLMFFMRLDNNFDVEHKAIQTTPLQSDDISPKAQNPTNNKELAQIESPELTKNNTQEKTRQSSITKEPISATETKPVLNNLKPVIQDNKSNDTRFSDSKGNQNLASSSNTVLGNSTTTRRKDLGNLTGIDTRRTNEIDKKEKLQVNLNLILKGIPELQLGSSDTFKRLPSISYTSLKSTQDRRLFPLIPLVYQDPTQLRKKTKAILELGARAALAYNYNTDASNQEGGVFLNRLLGKLSYGLDLHLGYNHRFFPPLADSNSSKSEEVPEVNVFLMDDMAALEIQASNSISYAPKWYVGSGLNFSYAITSKLRWTISTGMNRHLYPIINEDSVLNEDNLTQGTRTGAPEFIANSLLRNRWEPYLKSSLNYKLGELGMELGTQRGLKSIVTIYDTEYYNHNIFAGLNYTF